jgi:hypothetical protein
MLDFVLGDEGKATDLWVCGIELARIYPNFNYVFTFEMTLKVMREGSTEWKQ